MFDKDEKNNSGWDISEMSLKNCGAGGTFVLSLYSDWKSDKSLVRASKQGWALWLQSCVCFRWARVTMAA